MTKETHTLGPWVTDPEFDHQVVLGADGVMVADCAIMAWDSGKELRTADACRQNARLIAAAPDMLAALKGAVTLAEMLVWPKSMGDEVEAALKVRLEAIRAAVAKVESR